MVQCITSKTQNVLFSNKRSVFATFTSFSDDVINLVDSLGILGINLDSSPIWHNHIVSVAIKRLGFLRRCKTYLSPSYLLLIYKTFIMPIMDRIRNREIRLMAYSNITGNLDTLDLR